MITTYVVGAAKNKLTPNIKLYTNVVYKAWIMANLLFVTNQTYSEPGFFAGSFKWLIEIVT